MTIKEIAELAGVSTATVSKILNGKDKDISEATRKNVLDIVEREGYIPNGIAKSLRIKNTKTIGIIMPDVMNLFFSELARGVEDAAEKKGYSVILCNSDNKESKEEKYIQILQEKMVDGIILTASENSVKRSLRRRKIPMVLLDRDISTDEKVGRITVDNEEGTYNATKLLIEKGCKNIGFISSNKTTKSSAQRLQGYENAILESKINFDKNKIFLQNYTIETGYKGTVSLLEKTNIDGICCGNDLIAIGAIKALKERGIKVPQDVKVIGFDDISISKYMDPPLTTIRQPIYEMGEEAVGMLIDVINNKEMEMSKVLKTELIVRETT
ncbi:LacI family DNA-binding transcriptional regulator [Paratissierella segnis]|uniref:LacI family DNA-binding transcriptional regulator n=1 Tax=Paratissierella segnis TaxID=2763679 RepID=A0A926EZ68_9FIRM|nr:LacI family DNA-binding transcriptional regulator [Paratissierella segnis]MBC8588955.1 LacI family DNA-binding transcriptional regulator [Paratissierella segnis]